MLRMLKSTLLSGATLVALATTAPAQVTVGADLGVYSAYVWRGLTLTSKPVIQPDLWLSLPVGSNGAITVGGWANIELGKYDGSDEISEGGGEKSFDLTEFDPWIEYAHSFGQASLSIGATGYIYPNDLGLTSDNNTVELYGQLGLATTLSPQLAAYYDVDKIKGLYIEGSISHDLPVSETMSFTLGALVGFNAGQGCEPDSSDVCQTSESFNFFDNGLTHADFSISTSFALGSVAIDPVFHLQLSSDEFTKVNNLSDIDESIKLWFGVTLSWASGGEEE
jgi:uncharacterized protein (TIGR02001 family)